MSDSGSDISDVVFDTSPDSSDVEEEGDEDAGRQQIRVRGAEPYLYEPLPRERREDDQDEDEDDDAIDYNQRIDNVDWCDCGRCEVLPHFQPIECRCCHEVPQVKEKIEGQQQCVTQMEDFDGAFLNRLTLTIAWMGYTDRYRQAARAFDERGNEKYRYTAYRQLVRYCWGWLGKNIRVVIPACAHAKIDRKYPDPEGNYKGTELQPNNEL